MSQTIIFGICITNNQGVTIVNTQIYEKLQSPTSNGDISFSSQSWLISYIDMETWLVSKGQITIQGGACHMTAYFLTKYLKEPSHKHRKALASWKQTKKYICSLMPK